MLSSSSSTIGKKANQSFYQSLYKRGLEGMNYGRGSEVIDSGEADILDKITFDSANPVIFDVGAKYGDYSKMLLAKVKKNASVYAFDPDKANFAQLKNVLSGSPVKIFNIGFSDKPGKAELFSNEKYPGISSMYRRELSHIGVKMRSGGEAEFNTIDAFCEENNISAIDFLKLDTEGSELSILKGAKNLIEKKHIAHIQFEFGGCNIDSGTYFKDFFYLLSPGYTIFRILQDGLYPIEKYSESLEIFLTANFLAVRS